MEHQSFKKPMLILLAVFVGLSCAFMAIGAYFAYDALRKADQAAVDSRFALAVGRVVASVERAASYGITLPSAAAQLYCETLVAHPWMQQWYEAALQEPWRRATRRLAFGDEILDERQGRKGDGARSRWRDAQEEPQHRQGGETGGRRRRG